jgi:hypothetical protein
MIPSNSGELSIQYRQHISYSPEETYQNFLLIQIRMHAPTTDTIVPPISPSPWIPNFIILL